MSVYDFCGYLESRRQQLSLPKSRLAKQARISRSALYRILAGDVFEPDSNTIIKLAKALHVHPCHLIHQLLKNRPIQTGMAIKTRYKHDGIALVDDTKTPNNVLLATGSIHTKIWEFQNIGHVTWQRRRLACIDQPATHTANNGLAPLERYVRFPVVHPGEVIEISVTFRVPNTPGTFVSYWKMVDAEGRFCFPDHSPLECQIQAIDLQAHTG